ncbi:hypothetical protein [Kribbella sp. NPDC048915]|uniref:hypothetical protein n=1 Tax=Kribbella sp. NPDC048915 TaxID=3155148 RepID=UPI0033C8812D
MRAVWGAVRRLFTVPAVPPPLNGPVSKPRCLHCKVPMTARRWELPQPQGVWGLFGCDFGRCSICYGPCRNQARMFLPAHWETGLPGAITRL